MCGHFPRAWRSSVFPDQAAKHYGSIEGSSAADRVREVCQAFPYIAKVVVYQKRIAELRGDIQIPSVSSPSQTDRAHDPSPAQPSKLPNTVIDLTDDVHSYCPPNEPGLEIGARAASVDSAGPASLGSTSAPTASRKRSSDAPVPDGKRMELPDAIDVTGGNVGIRETVQTGTAERRPLTTEPVADPLITANDVIANAIATSKLAAATSPAPTAPKPAPRRRNWDHIEAPS